MGKQIRTLFKQSKEPLKNIVEMDETYMGQNRKRLVGTQVSKTKKPVIGAIERNGEARIEVADMVNHQSIIPFIERNIDPKASIKTDGGSHYKALKSIGYKHQSVMHCDGYVNKRTHAHVNNIEAFWGQIKRSINGTYHSVSAQHLQSYIDEFAYRYNHRASALPVFHGMAELAGKPV